jgi:DNA-binding PadR family transcriptional regulator
MSLTNALLGIIIRGPIHGHAIKQKFEGALGGEWQLSYGQMYPGLGRLVEAGYATRTAEPGDKANDRFLYAITDAGKAHFMSWLSEVPECQVRIKDDLSLRLASISLLDKKQRSKLLKAYRENVEERHAGLVASVELVEDPWMRSIAKRGVMACEAELAWLDTVIGN